MAANKIELWRQYTSGDSGDGDRHLVTSIDFTNLDIDEHRFTKVSEKVEGAFSLLRGHTRAY